MQKWSPEPFEHATVPAGGVVVDTADFTAEPATVASAAAAQGFRSEAGFADQQTLMASLTPEERAQIFELVEMDVAQTYAAREKTLAAEHAAQLAAAVAANDERLNLLTADLQELVRRDLTQAAAAAARLAVLLAGKLVRGQVALDPEILVRNLETILFKLDTDQPLTVHVNPADAEWLAERVEAQRNLNLTVITADRRVEAGGAIVKAGGREWDATLASQLESLNEIVEEMIATAGTGTRNAEDADEPGVD